MQTLYSVQLRHKNVRGTTANNQIQSKFSPLKRQCISATRKQSNIPEKKKDLHLKDMINNQA